MEIKLPNMPYTSSFRLCIRAVGHAAALDLALGISADATIMINNGVSFSAMLGILEDRLNAV